MVKPSKHGTGKAWVAVYLKSLLYIKTELLFPIASKAN